MKEMQGAGIGCSIAVQARQTTEETEWLLNAAEQTDFIAGVVGWVPLSEGSGGRVGTICGASETEGPTACAAGRDPTSFIFCVRISTQE